MNTSKIKRILSYLPEIFILLMAIYCFIDSLAASFSQFNYIAIGVIALVCTLILWRNKVMALTLSVVLGMASLYMLLTVYSEYNEFPVGSVDGIKLLLIGSFTFIFLLIMSILMPIKYFRHK